MSHVKKNKLTVMTSHVRSLSVEIFSFKLTDFANRIVEKSIFLLKTTKIVQKYRILCRI